MKKQFNSGPSRAFVKGSGMFRVKAPLLRSVGYIRETCNRFIAFLESVSTRKCLDEIHELERRRNTGLGWRKSTF
jgi:hypothetical protein